MKKNLYLFLSMLTVVLISCNQNNPSYPTNPNDPDNPSNPSTPTEVNKVKYSKENASWDTYHDTESNTNWGIGLWLRQKGGPRSQGVAWK